MQCKSQGKKIQIGGCVFTFSVQLEKWSFHGADLPRKKCTEMKKAPEGQSSCFASLNMPNLWRCRCRRVVDLKLSQTHSISQTHTQQVIQPVSQSVSLSVFLSFCLSVSQPIRQTDRQTERQTVSQLVKQRINRPFAR